MPKCEKTYIIVELPEGNQIEGEEFFELIPICWILKGFYVLHDFTGDFFDFFIKRVGLNQRKE
jgi:hypothetical protein